MKKIGNIIVAVIVALCWVYFFFRFPYTSTLAKIICLIILGPFTIKVIYSFMLEKSQKKSETEADSLAENFTPFSATGNSTQIGNDNVRYCSQCCEKNSSNDKYCRNCGKPL